MVRTRIAPSPTGFPHIGTIYQVLFDFVFARQHQGKFILRIEDTDRSRFVEGAEEVIYKSLEWFGLSADEDPKRGGPYAPYRQSERLDLYKKYALELVEKGHAYYCFCTKERLDTMRLEQQAKKQITKYDKKCLKLSQSEIEENIKKGVSHVIRLKVPENETVSFTDMILGVVSFNTHDIEDQVILKSDGFPTYHLGVVVDDHLMEITHIFRGREWIPSTPKHILLYQFFGWDIPVHAHLPLILNPDGKGKLSKRHGHASVDYYRDLGFFPEAVLNYLSNIVWYHPEGKEIYTIDEFIKYLDISKMNSGGGKFDLVKLEWMNGEYIRQMDNSELTKRISSFVGPEYSVDLIEKTVPLIKERIKKLSEYIPITEFFFRQPKQYEVDLNSQKEIFQLVHKTLSSLQQWDAVAIGDVLVVVAKELGMKNSEFFMYLRVGITGKKISPPLNESMVILGKDEVLNRLNFLQ
jgi:glutamyl-tRNA synthetase